MSTVLDEIAKETNGKSFKTYKYGFEGIAVPRFDYDDHRHRITWKQYGETEYHDKPCPVNAQYLAAPSLFSFFWMVPEKPTKSTIWPSATKFIRSLQDRLALVVAQGLIKT